MHGNRLTSMFWYLNAVIALWVGIFYPELRGWELGSTFLIFLAFGGISSLSAIYGRDLQVKGLAKWGKL